MARPKTLTPEEKRERRNRHLREKRANETPEEREKRIQKRRESYQKNKEKISAQYAERWANMSEEEKNEFRRNHRDYKREYVRRVKENGGTADDLRVNMEKYPDHDEVVKILQAERLKAYTEELAKAEKKSKRPKKTK